MGHQPVAELYNICPEPGLEFVFYGPQRPSLMANEMPTPLTSLLLPSENTKPVSSGFVGYLTRNSILEFNCRGLRAHKDCMNFRFVHQW